MAQCFKEANTLSKKRFNMERPSPMVLDIMMIIGIPKFNTLGDEVGPSKEALCDDLTLLKVSSIYLRDLSKTCATPRVL